MITPTQAAAGNRAQAVSADISPTDYFNLRASQAVCHAAAQCCDVPRNPSLTARAAEANDYLKQIEFTLAAMRIELFGEGNDTPKDPSEPACLEALIDEICHRSACLVGEVKAILGRL